MKRPQIFRRRASVVFAALDGIVRLMSWTGALVAATFLFILVFYITADVSARFFFRAPLKGTLEISELMLLVIIFFSITYTQVSKGHVRISIFTNRWSPRWQALSSVLYSVIGIGLFTMMILYGLKSASVDLRNGVTTDQLGVPIFLAKLVIPVGASLMVTELIVEFAQHLQQLIGER